MTTSSSNLEDDPELLSEAREAYQRSENDIPVDLHQAGDRVFALDVENIDPLVADNYRNQKQGETPNDVEDKIAKERGIDVVAVYDPEEGELRDMNGEDMQYLMEDL